MRITPRGRTLGVIGISFAVTAVLFGLFELLMVGASFLAILLMGLFWVAKKTPNAHVERVISPPHTQAKLPVTVSMTVPAYASGTLGIERIPNSLGSDIRVRIGKPSRTNVLYTFSPKMRGVYQIGPLDIIHTDPFSAFQRITTSESTKELVVYPSFDEIATIPTGVQRLGAIAHSPRIGRGEEFYGLRNYVIGDDLRHVHWKSSLRYGKPLVKQNEFLGEPKCVVVLDNCESKHYGTGETASIEAAVSAAASVCDLATRIRMRLRLISADGPLITARRSTEQEMLRALASVELSKKKNLLDSLGTVGSMSGTVLILITPGLTEAEKSAMISVADAAAAGAVVVIDAKAFDKDRAGSSRNQPTQVVGLVAVPIGPNTSFRTAWESRLRRKSLARA